MLSVIFSPFVMLWKMWAGIFAPIPNGAPYVAAFALAVVLLIAVKAYRTLRRRLAESSESVENKQLETYRRVMNLT